ncbi:MAG: hypothetical protein JNM84_14855 [Planctomycetes bacterium]|nr:hypothetical protein [Planctomycetota bacterium]
MIHATRRSFLAALAFAFVAPALGAQEADPRSAPRDPAVIAHEVAQRSRLETIDGVAVLFLSGTDRERGFDEGFLLCEEMVRLIDGFCLDPAVMPSPLAWKMLIRPRVLKTMDITPRLRERCEGLLAGMQAKRGGPVEPERLGRALNAEDLIAVSALPDLMGLLCSSFVAWDRSVAGGTPLVGRNLDYLTTEAICATVMVKVHARAGERRAWVEVGWPGALGCLTGYSEDGVYLAIHDVRPRGAKKEGLFTPRAHGFQEVLETLSPGPDLPERAAELLRSKRFIMGANGMLAWSALPTAEGSRGAAVLEIDDRYEVDRGVSVRRSEENCYIACSNHHRSRAENPRCRRYGAIWSGLGASAEAPLDRAKAWEVISSASVAQTLYRLVLDLERGHLELDRRASATSGDWKPRARLDLRALLSQATPAQPAKAQAEPVGAGR